MFDFVVKAAAGEVVPFLRRLETRVGDGAGIREAYTESLAETTVLKRVVGEPVEGLPFSEGLLEGAKRSQLRPLIAFATQVRLRERSGDGLKVALLKAAETTLRQEGPAAERAPRFDRRTKLALAAGATVLGALAVRRIRR